MAHGVQGAGAAEAAAEQSVADSAQHQRAAVARRQVTDDVTADVIHGRRQPPRLQLLRIYLHPLHAPRRLPYRWAQSLGFPLLVVKHSASWVTSFCNLATTHRLGT